jgi:hypothetical protein
VGTRGGSCWADQAVEVRAREICILWEDLAIDEMAVFGESCIMSESYRTNRTIWIVNVMKETRYVPFVAVVVVTSPHDIYNLHSFDRRARERGALDRCRGHQHLTIVLPHPLSFGLILLFRRLKNLFVWIHFRRDGLFSHGWAVAWRNHVAVCF